MLLKAGDRIGGYEVVALLGAGGMGEVYRARDSRLGREVAIKVLSPTIAADADGLMRFEREARMLAALNHPNIAAIYGVEDGAGRPALILELVEGETLAARIARGRLGVDEALAYARQIADALDAAHEAGIVHRDLKPGNIKITEAGTVKVLDFGLAKAIAAAASPDAAIDPSNSPTVTLKGTKGGVILGTAAYMSPEQARGKTIDKRTDIWAFGCVLFEMLTGRMSFSGETTSDVIAAIIEREPDWSKLPRAVPPHARRVIARCLEKDPKRRARDIADVSEQLADGSAVVVEQPSGRRQIAIAVAATLIVAVSGTAAVLRWASPAYTAPPPPIEFSFSPRSGRLAIAILAPSPDGSRIAFVARDESGASAIWVRSTDSAAPRKLAGSDGASGRVIWSADGRALAYTANGALKRAPADGGPIVTVAPGVAHLGASWNLDDVIIVAPVNRGPIMRVAASGGELTPVTRLDPTRENSHRWPHFLPDGRHFLFTVRSDKPENQGIKVGSLDSPEIKPLISVASPGVYVEPGWLLYVTPDSVLMAQPFDAATLSLSGLPQPLAANVRYVGPSAEAFFGASRDGSVLTFLPAPTGGSKLTWFDRSGKSLGIVGPERPYGDIRLSPDGRRIAVVIPDTRYATRDLWMLDAATNALTRVTTNAAGDWRPVWSPDGSKVAFASDRMGLSSVFLLSAALESGETLLYRAEAGGAFPTDWSRDGTRLLIHLDDAEGRPTDAMALTVKGSTVSRLLSGTARVGLSRFSPEADRIAFQSDATGAYEIYVMSLADGRRVRVSTDGGVNAMWDRDGREVFYLSAAGDLMAATLSAPGMALTASAPVRLFSPCGPAVGAAPLRADPTEVSIDVSRDGRRFVTHCDSPDTIPSAATIVINWQSKLR